MKKTISIIGGGPTSLLLAAFLDVDKFDITIYEKNKTLGQHRPHADRKSVVVDV